MTLILASWKKKVKKEVIYSKLDGTIAKVGDPVTGVSDGNAFMTIKSKEGYYVKVRSASCFWISSRRTILNCSGSNGVFDAEVVDVSEYPVSDEVYGTGMGNPNVSYYTLQCHDHR